MSYARRLHEVIEAHAPDPGLLARAGETARKYDAHSEGYDLTNPARKYFSPSRMARMLVRVVPDPELPVLDLACGTGLMGQALAGMGHRNMLGSDISPAMLDAAREKAIYRDLTLADLHGPLPFPSESFAGIACVGAFYEGLVHPRALLHILPLLRPEGWLACDVERGAWIDVGLGRLLLALQDAGLIDQLRIETGRLFARGYLGPGEDDSALEGRFVLARRSA